MRLYELFGFKHAVSSMEHTQCAGGWAIREISTMVANAIVVIRNDFMASTSSINLYCLQDGPIKSKPLTK